MGIHHIYFDFKLTNWLLSLKFTEIHVILGIYKKIQLKIICTNKIVNKSLKQQSCDYKLNIGFRASFLADWQ